MSFENKLSDTLEEKNKNLTHQEIPDNVFGRKRLRMMRELGIFSETDSLRAEQMKNEVIIRFDLKDSSGGLITQNLCF